MNNQRMGIVAIVITFACMCVKKLCFNLSSGCSLVVTALPAAAYVFFSVFHFPYLFVFIYTFLAHLD